MSYRPTIIAFYMRNPTATQEQCRRATGAPKATVRHVYASLVRGGQLRQRPQVDGKLQAWCG
jgi:hypothetical protein